jgi:hypothetical protein
LSADKIKSANAIRSHLSFCAGKQKTHHTPELCASCESQCVYGKRWLELLAQDGKDYIHIKPAKQGHTIRQMFQEAAYAPTVKLAIRAYATESRKNA